MDTDLTNTHIKVKDIRSLNSNLTHHLGSKRINVKSIQKICSENYSSIKKNSRIKVKSINISNCCILGILLFSEISFAHKEHPVYSELSNYLERSYLDYSVHLMDQFQTQLQDFSHHDSFIISELKKLKDQNKTEVDERNWKYKIEIKSINEQIALFHQNISLMKQKIKERDKLYLTLGQAPKNLSENEAKISQYLDFIKREILALVQTSTEAKRLVSEIINLNTDKVSLENISYLEEEYERLWTEKKHGIEEGEADFKREEAIFKAWEESNLKYMEVLDSIFKNDTIFFDSLLAKGEVEKADLLNKNNQFKDYQSVCKKTSCDRNRLAQLKNEKLEAKSKYRKGHHVFRLFQKEAAEREDRRLTSKKQAALELDQKRNSITNRKTYLTDKKEENRKFFDEKKDEISKVTRRFERDVKPKLNEMRSRLSEMSDNLTTGYSPEYDQFISVVKAWLEKEGVSYPDFEPIHRQGTQSEKLISSMISVSHLKIETSLLRSDLEKKKMKLDELESNLSSESRVSHASLISDLEKRLSQIELDFNEDLQKRTAKFKEKEESLMQKLGSQLEQELRNLYSLRLKVAAKEKTLIGAWFLSLCERNQNLILFDKDYVEVLSELEYESNRLKDVVRLNSAKTTSLFQFLKEHTEENDFHTNEVSLELGEPRADDEPLESTLLDDDNRRGVINQWMRTLQSENVAIECLPISGVECNSDIGKEEFTRFKKSLFREGLAQALIYEMTLSNGRKAYQVTLLGKTYWIGSKGDLFEFTEQDKNEHSFFEYQFISSHQGATGTLLKASYDDLKKKFEANFDTLEGYQQGAVLLAEGLLRAADLAQEEKERKELIELHKGMVDIALGFSPAGPAINLYEGIVGLSVHGEPLEREQRLIALVGLSIGYKSLASQIEKILSPIFKVNKHKIKFLSDSILTRKIVKDMDRVVGTAEKNWVSVKGLLHTVKGNLKLSTDGTFRLKSGMHTEKGLEHFIKLNALKKNEYIIKNVKTFNEKNLYSNMILKEALPNGVIRLQLPREAWHNNEAFKKAIVEAVPGQKVKGVKTLWPSHFTLSDIANTTETVYQNGKTGLSTERITGTFKNIKIRINVDNNRIVSSFPEWHQ